ncbi:MAG: SOS response-associated peptidase family protein [Oscillospiraceae bacterium]|nr:SOS response-associated peptidase family protein [Oscillospiraceae bacterium]MCR5174689.1 SOS response-associated peptidase [Oscillospiraceae bacterium]
MCTRFYVEPETEELRWITEALRRSRLTGKFIRAGDAVLTAGEMRPSNVLPVVAPDRNGDRAVYPMRWGFSFPNHRPVVNARSETAAELPAFRDSWKNRRCMIPASWYYEWEHLPLADGKTKPGDRYMFQPRGEAVCWLCGLYRIEDGLPCFVVLTREAEGAAREIHGRMPLILPEGCLDAWIRPGTKPEDLLALARTDVIAERAERRPKRAETLDAAP